MYPHRYDIKLSAGTFVLGVHLQFLYIKMHKYCRIGRQQYDGISRQQYVAKFGPHFDRVGWNKGPVHVVHAVGNCTSWQAADIDMSTFEAAATSSIVNS